MAPPSYLQHRVIVTFWKGEGKDPIASHPRHSTVDGGEYVVGKERNRCKDDDERKHTGDGQAVQPKHHPEQTQTLRNAGDRYEHGI